MEIVDALRRHGAVPERDIQALWRRIVFNILISNTDDHLRNHGFLYAGTDGWQLSPAYDLNPVPPEIRPRVPSTAINEDDGTASLDLRLRLISSSNHQKPAPSPPKSARPCCNGACRQRSVVSERRRSTAWQRLSSMMI
jgi:HipA-like C-terminal domain